MIVLAKGVVECLTALGDEVAVLSVAAGLLATSALEAGEISHPLCELAAGALWRGEVSREFPRVALK